MKSFNYYESQWKDNNRKIAKLETEAGELSRMTDEELILKFSSRLGVKHGAKRFRRIYDQIENLKTKNRKLYNNMAKAREAEIKPKTRKKTPVRVKTPKPYTGKLSFWT